MSAKKKRGRPPKRDHSDFLAAFGHMAELTPEDCGLSEEEAEQLIKSCLLTDPLRNDPGMMIFSPCITGNANEDTRKHTGLFLADSLKELKADQLSDLFDRILKLKRTAEKAEEQGPHRVVHAYQAYCDFKREFGFKPTKQKLKKIMLAHLKCCDLPTVEDTKGWSDLFELAGLSDLEPGFWPVSNS